MHGAFESYEKFFKLPLKNLSEMKINTPPHGVKLRVIKFQEQNNNYSSTISLPALPIMI